jgi:hypothetical protein
MSWVVTRVVDAGRLRYSATQSLGRVELRAAKRDSPRERAALQASQESFGERPPLNSGLRISNIVERGNPWDVASKAEPAMIEALDILGADLRLCPLRLCRSGFIRNADSLEVLPLEQEPEDCSAFGAVFWLRRGMFPPAGRGQRLLLRPSDLAKRLIRSYHWSRLGDVEATAQLRLLFHWFAIEAIWKVGRGNDDIIPRVMWSLGFPTGRGLLLVPPWLRQALVGVPNYRAWRKCVYALLQAARRFRDDTVHSGFRSQDIAPDRLLQVGQVVELACPRTQENARVGIDCGLVSPDELVEYLPLLFVQAPRVVGDTRTVIGALRQHCTR